MKMPILHEGEIMIHADTLTVGQVVDTFYPDDRLERIEQVLRLKDGTRRQFRLVELTSAAPITVEQFWQGATFTRVFGDSPRVRPLRARARI